MIDAAQKVEEVANVIAVEPMPVERLHSYGVVGIGERNGELLRVTEMVEKPPSNRAPSNLIITGRYILQPQIFDLLAAQKAGAGGEIQLTDAMIALSNTQPFYGLKFAGRSFDCGSKVGFLAANVAYALARDDLGSAMREMIEQIVRSSPTRFEQSDGERISSGVARRLEVADQERLTSSSEPSQIEAP